LSIGSGTEIEVSRSVTVPLTPEQTFELFTARTTEFWPKEHSINSSEIAAVVIEPREEGRWFERGVDGSECDWGGVAVWQPPRKLVLLWQIGADWRFDPDLQTEVEVTFSEESPGRTRLDLRHRHLERYGEAAEQMRAEFDSPGGWESTLAACAKLASG
jgi:uncharacterized protein YndB with AHSA1/START domain